MSDVFLLTGLGSIINQNAVKPGIDVDKVINETIAKAQNAAPVAAPAEKSFNEELNDYLKNELGIYPEKPRDEYFEQPAQQDETQYYAHQSEHAQHAQHTQHVQPAPYVAPITQPPQYDAQPAPYVAQPTQYKHVEPIDPFDGVGKYGPYSSRTNEQRGRDAITATLGYQDSSFSLEQEKMEEHKTLMLVEIDSLLESLAEAGINTSRVPVVGTDSTYKQVEKVLLILRFKNDNARCTLIAQEMLIFAAYQLEDLFDGKKDWAGYKPDLTGWHNNVQMRMRRIQPETGRLVSGVLEACDTGPLVRLLIELVPNMFIYAKRRKEQHGQPGVFSDSDMADAHSNIR